MIIGEVTESYPICTPEPRVARSTGLHLSQIVRAMAIKHGNLEETETDMVGLLRMNIGLAWEVHYVQMLTNGLVPWPGERQVDGIWMTPDGESLAVVEGRTRSYRRICHEYKATYKSLKNVEKFNEQWMWMAQIMAYSRAMKVTLAHLHVLFICGDYKMPIQPIRKVYEFEFTTKELEDNWRALITYAGEMPNGR